MVPGINRETRTPNNKWNKKKKEQNKTKQKETETIQLINE